MKKIIILLVLMFTLFEVKSGGPTRLTITPSNIFESDLITVGVDPFFSPCLIFLDNLDGERFDVQVSGNQITLTFVSIFFNPCPGTGGGPIENFEIGSFTAGNYDVIVNTVGPNVSFPLAGGENPVQIGQPISIQVLGSPQAVPATSIYLLILLGFVMILTVRNTFKNIFKKQQSGTCIP